MAPLPTISRHIRERGFDHTAKLAKAVSRHCGGKYGEALLRKNTSVQVGKNAEERNRQAKLAYIAKSKKLGNEKYMLVDDVWTTGSSMIAACEELRKVGVQNIGVLLLAKSE